MRINRPLVLISIVALTLLSGCSTFKYASERSALEVSECIGDGWRKSPRSGYEAPVSVTKAEEYYFVSVDLIWLVPNLVITGARHPFRPVWAEVRDTPSGSATTYHRAYQIMHENIDRAVIECQELKK